ncbi:hypothetical protein LINPERHAP1_LOCUS11733 [Linum perenne]
MKHTYHEGNKAADFLVGLGHSLHLESHVTPTN